jgi:hypothetical protein
VLPGALAALGCGRLDVPRLGVLVDEVGCCGPAAAAVVEAAVLAGGPGAWLGEFRRRTRAALLTHDPAGAAARAESARADAHVRVRPAGIDTAWLEALLAAQDAAAVRTVLDAAAAAMRRDGDRRPIDQRRAAALAAPFWTALTTGLLATPDGPLPLSHLGGQAPALTLTRLDGRPSELGGFGPLTDGGAQAIAALARPGRRPLVRVLDVDPAQLAAEGQNWPVEAGYRPSRALRAHLAHRDRTCRFPSCPVPAQRTDADHTLTWPRGPTHPANLALLCRRHHRLKQSRHVTLTQPRPGVLDWTMPTGLRYTTGPAGTAED